jgi:hypothetical protein
MTRRNRILLVGLWALSLVAAVQLAVSAGPDRPGTEVRFIQTGARNGLPAGHFTAKVGGAWVIVELDVPKAPLQPLIDLRVR